jgi:predicted small lipoprotein YifL
MRTRHVLVIFGLAATILACGQKGPLVLPDAQHPHKKIGIGKPPVPPAPAPASPAPAIAPSGAATAPNATPDDATPPPTGPRSPG